MVSMFYVTAKNESEALTIARTLLEEQLIACANVIPTIRSLYRWQGKTIDDCESLMIAKTDKKLAEKVTARIRQLHSYECPCIIHFTPAGGFSPFLDWVSANCPTP